MQVSRRCRRQPLLDPLSHRGGLRADVLEDGEIRIGDELRPVER